MKTKIYWPLFNLLIKSYPDRKLYFIDIIICVDNVYNLDDFNLAISYRTSLCFL